MAKTIPVHVPPTTTAPTDGATDTDAVPWPDRPRDEVFYGLAGDVVRTIEPETESDPIALLVQFLVFFGNAIGHGPHFMAEADRHALNLFVVLVGVTSKGRKGTSLGHIRRLFEAVDPHWVGDCVKSGLSSGEGIVWAVRDGDAPSTRGD